MGRYKDLTGLRFGKLIVKERAENTKDHKAQWLCICDCGNNKVVTSAHLRSGAVKSCGCLNNVDLSGQVFERLTVIAPAPYRNHVGYSKCQCSCGNVVEVRNSALLDGNTKSCGCLNREVQKQQHKENRYEIHGDVTIMYTQKGEPFTIDTEDLARVKQMCWYMTGTRRIHAKRNISLHRFVLNAPKGATVDHISGDTTNNCKSNLRLCTTAENCRNRKQLENTTSGITGVYLSHNGKWRARITYEGERIHLGYFDTKEQAEAARLAAEDKYFGEFSRRNSRGK